MNNLILTSSDEQFDNYLKTLIIEIEGQSINWQNNLDVIILKPNGSSFTAEQIEHYIQEFAMKPVNLQRKYGIIYSGHYLSQIQQNKLLKTIEDSKEWHYHMVQAISSSKLLATFTSRFVQKRINFETDELEKLKIINNEAKAFLKDNSEKFEFFVKLQGHISRKEYEQASLLLAVVKLTKIEAQIVIELLQYWANQSKQYEQIQIIFEYEQRINFNVNYNLQIASLLAKISK